MGGSDDQKEQGGACAGGGGGGPGAEAVGKYWENIWLLIPSSSRRNLSLSMEMDSSFLLIVASWLDIFVWAKLSCIFRNSWRAASSLTAGPAAFLCLLEGGGFEVGGGMRGAAGFSHDEGTVAEADESGGGREVTTVGSI